MFPITPVTLVASSDEVPASNNPGLGSLAVNTVTGEVIIKDNEGNPIPASITAKIVDLSLDLDDLPASPVTTAAQVVVTSFTAAQIRNAMTLAGLDVTGKTITINYLNAVYNQVAHVFDTAPGTPVASATWFVSSLFGASILWGVNVGPSIPGGVGDTLAIEYDTNGLDSGAPTMLTTLTVPAATPDATIVMSIGRSFYGNSVNGLAKVTSVNSTLKAKVSVLLS